MLIEPVTEGNYFHIYNRGINGEDIFKEEKNYSFFLQQYKKYCSDVCTTLSYVLLKNHFHLLVYIKENVIVPRKDGRGTVRLNASVQFSHFFNSYAQAVNKAYNRTGSLLESPFERKMIDDDHYITSMIFYCHYNAQLHGMTDDFKSWPHSSYHAVMNDDNTVVHTENTLSRFGSKYAFEKQHEDRYRTGGLYLNLFLPNQPPTGPKPPSGFMPGYQTADQPSYYTLQK